MKRGTFAGAQGPLVARLLLLMKDDMAPTGREWADARGARDERGDDRRTSHLQPHSDMCSETQSGAPPRRKDTPYQHSHPFTQGTKLLRAQTESFPEEEEGVEEQEEDMNP
ncbi:hypothetical protein SKAU_G00236420 [Synaphobranchus kaupii]|uniref:Uncharacterized protein n=1 Tax=Synaphobranchus kaupii TaxID=118154 RepID=A0A9Q1ITW6_SYNKA|nr:hypothetical protein SKAU_G00236420 [Synaphobranchus kaupii]